MRHEGDRGEWVYGINPVAEALRSGRSIRSLHVQSQKHEHIRELLGLAREQGLPVKHELRDFFDSRFPKGHQGIAALIGARKTLGIEELLRIPGQKGEPPFFLVLDGVEDPRNFGAILRVADAAGVHGVVFQSHRSAGVTPVVSKASAGALEHVNLAEVVNVKHAIDKMKKMDIAIIGAEAGPGLSLWDVDMKAPLALVMGSEGRGLRRTVRELCDVVVSLPMKGSVNSLNVSVATGILAYEVLRQRKL